MYVLPETLDQHLRFLSVRFNMKSMQTLGASEGERCQKPRCILTFDDGWQDFYDFAFPLLRKYQVPATVFLPTGFIGSDAVFWTDRLASTLRDIERLGRMSAGSLGIDDPLGNKVLGGQAGLAERIEYSINVLKEQDSERIEKVLHQLADLASGIPNSKRKFLTWDQVRELLASGLVDFGSHTVRHMILTHLSRADIKVEMEESKHKLIQERAVQPESIPFCYPNGNYSQSIQSLVQEAGYSSACTTEYGINTPSSNRFALQRIGIHQDMSAHAGLLGCRMLGIF
jgi:peptidoglycan/xylan/chitin deacetylase (PgdA/CDA1 family)